jgi:F0F1-type ATP synthase beta subunit
MENGKISLISTDISAIKEYQDYTGGYINSLNEDVSELKERVASMEKILLSATNIDWKTVRFLDEPETFK